MPCFFLEYRCGWMWACVGVSNVVGQLHSATTIRTQVLVDKKQKLWSLSTTKTGALGLSINVNGHGPWDSNSSAQAPHLGGSPPAAALLVSCVARFERWEHQLVLGKRHPTILRSSTTPVCYKEGSMTLQSKSKRLHTNQH
ncbi:hypothetical protein TWF106_004151 [Orbilia oligospora]|uniref:Uncharacterized protein n=1 Tax=Orbilia oligospora TaxID=2813651 RepID=A0A7C8V3B7_ORBOL|nr:hypothetical protein TWF106_004151 [Orbilia oligospora]